MSLYNFINSQGLKRKVKTQRQRKAYRKNKGSINLASQAFGK